MVDIKSFIYEYNKIKELILDSFVEILPNYYNYSDYDIISIHFDESGDTIYVEYSYIRKGYVETNGINFPSKYLFMSNEEIRLDIEFLKDEKIRLQLEAEELKKKAEFDADMKTLNSIKDKYNL